MNNDDPPKRTESTELTIVRPRESLAPMSTRPVTIEDVGYVERTLRSVQDDVPTLVACPACAECRCCHGEHMVTGERAVTWTRDHETDSEPPPRAA